MTPTIEMKPLSRGKRRLIFILALVLFICAVPISVFYAIGYRFDLSEVSNIKSVGGMYVRSDAENTEIFVNDEPVMDMRIFQRAAYIQNLDAGMHRLHVQGDQVQTWVKELPVYAHFVTEVASFNLPKVPQIRILTQWNDSQTGAGIVFDAATSTEFNFASTTNPLRFSSTTATSSFVSNTEYLYIESLFASSTELKNLLQRQSNPVKFTFDVPTSSAQVITATTTKRWRDNSLFEDAGEVYVSWDGDAQDIPYYYCVVFQSKKKTSAEYGDHVYEALLEQFSNADLALSVGERLCRDRIRIDRLDQEFSWFDFYPDRTDIVLMLLEDGLYAVEVDDRAWQNTQLLYPGENLDAIQDGGRIYVHDGEHYIEVFTEIASQS